MYAKIYKELFINDYSLKKQIKDNIWVVSINRVRYYLFVYNDLEIVEGFEDIKNNEAELLNYKFIENTEERIKANKEFYSKIKEIKKKNSCLFRRYSNNNQCFLFSIDNF